MTIGRIPSVDGGIQPTIVDAKGDLIVATAADTVSRLAVGSNDQVLTCDSSQATGIKWAAPASSIPANATATVATEEGTTSSTYTDLPTAGPSVTVTSGTKALVILTAFITTHSNHSAFMSYAVSGATTISASDSVALHSRVNASSGTQNSSASVVTLTAGSNTFTSKYRTDSGSAGVPLWKNRGIFVINLA